MTLHRSLITTLVIFGASVAALSAQDVRPANVPIHTWVREDMFAGFVDDDFARFQQGEKKVAEYLAETPPRAEAMAWMVGGKLYRASREFRAGRTAEGDLLMKEALDLMDRAITAAPENLGVRATLGGSIVQLANKLPEKHYQPLMQQARTHFEWMYGVQGQAVSRFPLHIKGELLAGVAETEFRVGDRTRATDALNQIIREMPDTAYAKSAANWLAEPEKVTRDTKLVCQSCHEPGRLAAWRGRQR